MSMTENAAKKRRRTEKIGIEFNEHGEAIDWVFDVVDAFKESLDIKYMQYVDKEKTKELRRKLGRDKDGSGKPVVATRMAWTRGVPPTLSFQQGHVFYDPPGARRKGMPWNDALAVMRRAVRVREAKPDTEDGQRGWVKFELSHYEQGKVLRTEQYQCSQQELEIFLKTGVLSSNVAAQS